MDSQCGKTGSHAAMMRKEGTKDAKDCTDHCVKMLRNPSMYGPIPHPQGENMKEKEKAFAAAVPVPTEKRVQTPTEPAKETSAVSREGLEKAGCF
jgi:hypothetical protein